MSANIPNPFGGFAPFPNSIMIPFMGAQSAVLGYEFGLAYETGKRTIKAMPNDLFNKIVAGSDDPINVVYDGQEYTMKYSEYIDFLVKNYHNNKIDEFTKNLPSYMALQNTLIDKTVEIEVAKANRTPSAFREIFEAFTSGFTEQQKGDFGNFLEGLSDGWSKFLSFFGVNTTTTEPPGNEEQTTFNEVITYYDCSDVQLTKEVSYVGTYQDHVNNIQIIKDNAFDSNGNNLITNCNYDLHEQTVKAYEAWLINTYAA